MYTLEFAEQNDVPYLRTPNESLITWLSPDYEKEIIYGEQIINLCS